MTDAAEVAAIPSGERLARFVTFKHWVRPSDNSVKPDAFMPPRNLNLSVTRHIGLSEEELWAIGKEVARRLQTSERRPCTDAPMWPLNLYRDLCRHKRLLCQETVIMRMSQAGRQTSHLRRTWRKLSPLSPTTYRSRKGISRIKARAPRRTG